jgi:hypothetical protein
MGCLTRIHFLQRQRSHLPISSLHNTKEVFKGEGVTHHIESGSTLFFLRANLPSHWI